MHRLITILFGFLLIFTAQPVMADLPYIPLKLEIKAHKSMVLEGEKIGFTISVINTDPTRSITLLHPGKQNMGKKLVYFNLYTHQNVNGLWAETESRDMHNAMVHGPYLYPDRYELKPLDTLQFDVFFNASPWMETQNHHEFSQTLLTAGYYKFQCFYNPFGTITGDTLFQPYDDFHENTTSGKPLLWSSGLVSSPANITILKNPDFEIVIGHNMYRCLALNSGETAYINDLGDTVQKMVVTNDLMPHSNASQKDFKVVPYFPEHKTCRPDCKFCYAVTHQEFELVEILIRRKIRQLRKLPNGLGPLASWLNSHKTVAFVYQNAHSLSSLPSAVSYTLGLAHNPYEMVPFQMNIQTGKVGKITFYSFQNRAWMRSTDIKYLKVTRFESDSALIDSDVAIALKNYRQQRDDGGLCPVTPLQEYLFAQHTIQTGYPKHLPFFLNCCYSDLKTKAFKNQDAAALVLLMDTSNLALRHEILTEIFEKGYTLALPYLLECARLYTSYPFAVPLRQDELHYLESLYATISKLSGLVVYDPVEIEADIITRMKKGLDVWNNYILARPHFSDGSINVLEAKSQQQE